MENLYDFVRIYLPISEIEFRPANNLESNDEQEGQIRVTF